MKFEFNEKRHMYTLDGNPLMGITSILGVIAKPALIPWAVKMAVEHLQQNPEDWEGAKKAHAQKRDDSADLGTKVHAMIETYVKDKIKKSEEAKTEDLLPQEDQLCTMYNHFINWAIRNDVKFLESEKRMYNEALWIAGTADLVVEIDGKVLVGDIKTTSGIYDRTPFFQCAGYAIMLQDMGIKTEGSVIIRLGKDGSFEEKYSYAPDDREGFLACLTLYKSLNSYKKSWKK